MANGHVLATVQFGDSTVPGRPGGVAEFDDMGAFVRVSWSRDAAFPGAHIRTYSLTVVPGADRLVTTSSPMDNEVTADVVQVWRLSDLTLLKTLRVPEVSGDTAHRNPFEVHTLADGSVMMNTYFCGFYRLTDVATDPKIARVLRLSAPSDRGCVAIGVAKVESTATSRTP